MQALAVRPSGTYIDATFGRGGHSRLILSRLSGQGRLVALDRDPSAVAAARSIADPRFHIEHTAFSRLRATLQSLGLAEIAQRLDTATVAGFLARESMPTARRWPAPTWPCFTPRWRRTWRTWAGC